MLYVAVGATGARTCGVVFTDHRRALLAATLPGVRVRLFAVDAFRVHLELGRFFRHLVARHGSSLGGFRGRVL